MRRCLAAVLVLFLAGSAAAQSNGVFDSYQDLRGKLDQMMLERRVGDALFAFGGGDEYTPDQLRELDEKVAGIYPQNFTDVAMIRTGALQNGWRQELIGYWNDTSYIYAYLLLHEQPDRIVAVKFQFNSDFAPLNGNF
ncbi:hypothetical protein ACOXXX_02215 [Thalassococcus sp. BH17M4-6]|uniref:hypothetical protein n=1 Tax=Thalassococcus sp. BH17M4-6 TaxID=3413148 RepID=UPI003BD4C204